MISDIMFARCILHNIISAYENVPLGRGLSFEALMNYII